MSDYQIGYGNPPHVSRYKPGVSGNLKGRPKRQSLTLGEIIDRVLGGPITYRDRGRNKSATRDELSLKMLIDAAVGGDVAAAELVLKVRAHAQRFGRAKVDRIEIHNWLPERPGQTADMKAKEFSATGTSTDPVEWWNEPKATPSHPSGGNAG
jgi:Family of unknown function (DUF5681)